MTQGSEGTDALFSIKVTTEVRKMKAINWDTREGMILLDALHNCHQDVIGTTPSNIDHAEGVLVGVVAGLMHAGYGFDEVWEQILRRVQVWHECVPASWPSLADYDEAKVRASKQFDEAYVRLWGNK